EREHLYLLAHGDLRVILPLAVEVAERRFAEGADGGEAGRDKVMLFREPRERLHDLIALLEDQGPRRRAGLLVQAFRLHAALLSLGLVRRCACSRRVAMASVLQYFVRGA